MASFIHYAVYIIDLTDAMLTNSSGLNEQQVDFIQTIHRRSVQFVTDFLQYENGSLDHYLSYLNHDAMSPLSVIIGYSEFMLMGGAGDIQTEYREAVEEIRNCGHYLRDQVTRTQKRVLKFMKQAGIIHRSRGRATGRLTGRLSDTGTLA
jgi:signal transduction histidine kinase